jgi:uncharacterized protein
MVSGTFIEFMRDNFFLLSSKFKFQLVSGRLSGTLGFFLVGLWTAKHNLITNRRLMNMGFSLANFVLLFLLATGMVLVLAGIIQLPDLQFKPSHKWFLQLLFTTFNATVAVWYICFLARQFESPTGRTILLPFTYPGRMALSNYLLQTVFGLLLFYPFTFALFLKTSPALNVLMIIPVFTIQVIFSRFWLRKFSQGPLEMLWSRLAKGSSERRLLKIDMVRRPGSGDRS